MADDERGGGGMTEDVPGLDPDQAEEPRVRRVRRVGAARAASTPDQRLLDTGSQLNTSTDMWRVLRIQSEFVEGFGALATLGPAVSVFGSARIRPGEPAYAVAEDI